MRISDWSSDVCSSDLVEARRVDDVLHAHRLDDAFPVIAEERRLQRQGFVVRDQHAAFARLDDLMPVEAEDADIADRAGLPVVIAGEIGRASCRERVCPYV